jgi:ribosomal-protein-alanine N-acetyltransferase
VEALWEEFPIIATERLTLRELRTDDAPALHALFSDPDMMRYWGTPHDSLARTEAMIASISEAYRERRGIEWAVTFETTGEVIGKVCHHRLMRDHFRSEIGYILAKQHRGQGFIHEALRAVIAFGFAALKLHSIEAQLDPENVRSARLLERLGFVKEAHLKENYFVHGGFVDTAIYSLLASSTSR